MDTKAKKILKMVFLLIFLLFIITYIFFRSKDLVLGVKIKDVNINGLPALEEIKITNNIVKITGNAKYAINLTLDGRVISINQKGDFDETIVMLSGYNIISLEAKDQFGNSDEKNYKLMYK